MDAVAVLGLGEAGGRLAADLAAAGVEVRGYDPAVPGELDDARSAVAGAGIVLSLTGAAAALAAATDALPALREGALYADLNTAAPALKREIAALAAGHGARFADVALLGPVPARGLRTPVVVSGTGARAFARMFEPLGMPVDVVSDEAGDAAAMKLLRSVFMKGLAASAIESLEAAERSGHAAWLTEEIAEVIGRPLLDRLVEGSRTHAARRVDEMEAASALLRELGVEPRIAAASAALLADLSDTAVRVRTMATATEMRPSERARELVRGAFDLHVHIAPDVPARIIDDVSLAHRFAEVGLAGFGLKSHYTSTAERARVVSGVADGVRAIGTITLNWAVGGMNPLAVEIAAREGAKIVWMPTVDSPAETAGRTEPKPGDKVPQWAKLQHELRELGFSIDAVRVTGDDGELLPETRLVLRTIARHGLVLATAHLGRDDTFAVVDSAFAEGVEHVVVTHPEFTCQNFSLEDQVALADKGCLVERCLTTPHSGKTTFEHVFDGVRAVGIERNVFSSDCGNPDYPPVEDGLAIWADRLLEAGFTEDEIRLMVVENSQRLAEAA